MSAPGAVVWWKGARPRTLGAAIVPVVLGTAAADGATLLRALGVLTVALGLQVGVNYANDYHDGVRGVDTHERVGPVRLVSSGLASPKAVARAAGLAFLVAAVAGLMLARATDLRILWIGAAALLAAVAYSGGPRPYAGLGLGEVMVLAFFGFAAVCGTAYVQGGTIPARAWWAAVPVGLFAVAILMANNIRDIPTDDASGKRTLAVRLGGRRARALYQITVIAGLLAPIPAVAVGAFPVGTLLALTAAPLAAAPLRMIGSAEGPDLIKVLQSTALLHAQFGLSLAFILWLT